MLEGEGDEVDGAPVLAILDDVISEVDTEALGAPDEDCVGSGPEEAPPVLPVLIEVSIVESVDSEPLRLSLDVLYDVDDEMSMVEVITVLEALVTIGKLEDGLLLGTGPVDAEGELVTGVDCDGVAELETAVPVLGKKPEELYVTGDTRVELADAVEELLNGTVMVVLTVLVLVFVIRDISVLKGKVDTPVSVEL